MGNVNQRLAPYRENLGTFYRAHSDTNKMLTDVANDAPTINQPNANNRNRFFRRTLSDFRVGYLSPTSICAAISISENLFMLFPF
jgi:hypothetical protein